MEQNLFSTLKIDHIIYEDDQQEYSVNGKLEQTTPYRPELSDLISLYNLVDLTSRTTILEFGCGWSSLIFAASLKKSQEENNITAQDYRRNNLFECHSVDSIPLYIETAKKRVPESMQQHLFIKQSDVDMTLWNGRVATEYRTLPLISPDLIYIDAPDQFNINGTINGWSTRHKDMMPMSCDILKIEHFLTPKTIIVVDGRAANARFIKSNLQRKWDYKYCKERDQHFFLLEEEPLGKYSEAIINELYYKKGKWTINEL